MTQLPNCSSHVGLACSLTPIPARTTDLPPALPGTAVWVQRSTKDADVSDRRPVLDLPFAAQREEKGHYPDDRVELRADAQEPFGP